MSKMDKNVALVKILEAAKIYEKELNNKSYLILAKRKNDVVGYSLVFSESNFMHFTGIKSSLSATDFYKVATTRKMGINDFVIEDDFLVKKKLNVLADAVKLPKTAKMIGEFQSAGIKIKADIGSGNVNYIMAFRKDSRNKNVFVPVSVMDDDVRTVTSSTSPIVAILRKNKSDSFYNELTYKSKNINFDNLHIPKELKNIITIEILQQLNPTVKIEEVEKATKNVIDNIPNTKKEKVRVSIKEKLPEMKEKSEKLFGKSQLKQQDLQHKNKTHHEEL